MKEQPEGTPTLHFALLLFHLEIMRCVRLLQQVRSDRSDVSSLSFGRSYGRSLSLLSRHFFGGRLAVPSLVRSRELFLTCLALLLSPLLRGG